ncbi:site-specific integrase [Streptomyces sp. NBC_00885]|uniref:site-specific integrase n=1 Tax=Streptomyces sp. NBC_00885 TaxID=2975857 RepID=UPI0038705374|nr:site-specific integrase [Streptomyces sp. NBC_00885]
MTTETPGRRPKAGNGEDSIYWDKSKNRYVGAVSRGYAPDGTRRRPKVYGRTKTEVRTKLRDLKRDLAAGVKTSSKYTVERAVNDWLARGLKGRDQASLKAYCSLAKNHVIPDLGKAKLHELGADDVDEWLEAKSEELAHETLKRIRSILRRSIALAQRDGAVTRNVAELVELPDGQAGRPSKSLTLEQAQKVLKARPGTWIHAYVVLALLVGMRTEEERPLTWAHVHTETGHDTRPHVDVWRSVRKKGDTKTKKSRRSLAMPKQAAAVVDAHRKRQQEACEAAGVAWTPDCLVFPNDEGQLRSSKSVLTNFRALLKEAGIEAPKQWTTRELRTSFVSLMSDHGIPIEVIARVVGHSGTATTERVYRKQIRPVITSGAEAMEDIFKA